MIIRKLDNEQKSRTKTADELNLSHSPDDDGDDGVNVSREMKLKRSKNSLIKWNERNDISCFLLKLCVDTYEDAMNIVNESVSLNSD